jgi:hypothetical protein
LLKKTPGCQRELPAESAQKPVCHLKIGDIKLKLESECEKT